MSYKREITTLGRGGSDTTAVALAAALARRALRDLQRRRRRLLGRSARRRRPEAPPRAWTSRCSARWPRPAPRSSTRRPSSGRAAARSSSTPARRADPVGGGRETRRAATTARSRAPSDENRNVRAIVGIGGVMVARVALVEPSALPRDGGDRGALGRRRRSPQATTRSCTCRCSTCRTGSAARGRSSAAWAGRRRSSASARW